MLENKMVLDYETEYIENDAEEYLEHLYEEDDRIYEDEIFEEINTEEPERISKECYNYENWSKKFDKEEE